MLVSFSPASIADLDSMYDYIIWGGQKQPQSEKKKRKKKEKKKGGGGGGGRRKHLLSGPFNNQSFWVILLKLDFNILSTAPGHLNGRPNCRLVLRVFEEFVYYT